MSVCFFIFCLKGKTICIYLSGGISFTTLDFFIWFCILYGILLWINVISADRTDGHQRIDPSIYKFVSTLYLLCDHLGAVDQAKFLCSKKEEMLYEQRHSFLFRFSIWFEITFIILGCILESFINPSIMSGILNLWK